LALGEAREGEQLVARFLPAISDGLPRLYARRERDAEAIAEAATRPTMRFVELKREEQLAYRCQRLRPARQGRSLHRVQIGVPWLT
jgi:hypothetical protein